jgi:hypothetical protein
MTTYTPPPEPGRTASRRNRPVPLVIGILLALMGLPLLLGGLGLGWAVATQRDDVGFFSTPTEQPVSGQRVVRDQRPALRPVRVLADPARHRR